MTHLWHSLSLSLSLSLNTDFAMLLMSSTMLRNFFWVFAGRLPVKLGTVINSCMFTSPLPDRTPQDIKIPQIPERTYTKMKLFRILWICFCYGVNTIFFYYKYIYILHMCVQVYMIFFIELATDVFSLTTNKSRLTHWALNTKQTIRNIFSCCRGGFVGAYGVFECARISTCRYI